MSEREISVCCALRFDGWSYIENQKFDHQEVLKQHFESGQWNLAPLQQLAVFFVLQRGLMKWGLERQPQHGKYWKAFRELFLLYVEYEIPKRYHQPEYCERWEREYQPQLAAYIQLIEEIHRNTVYDDNASPLV